ncbi:MAG TPA: glycosyl transferase family 1, partial [Opitutus sp.]|nr:glycosyl transferase family 1 [Opitutus sp.]
YRKARLVPAHKRLALKTLEQGDYQLPECQLDHLRRLTDGTGILHHATHCVPDFSGGYRTIDNAFALRLAVLLEETGDDAPDPAALASTYAAFIGHAFQPDTASFHDHLSFDHRWLGDGESDEILGAAAWALGTCIGRSRTPGLQRWAAQLFERTLPAIARTTTPRACALGLLGIHEYFRRLSGDRVAEDAREILTQRLLDLFRQHERAGWTWFEPALGYANAWLPHALILAGRWNARHDALDTGLRSLRWLLARQTAPSGDFRPTDAGAPSLAGSPARLDQKPSEAAATVAACIEAHAATRDPLWVDEARRAFEWFLGRNELGESLYDPTTGGCCDALHVDRLNLNQGAESTLAFLLALQEMRLLDTALHAESPEVGPLTEPLPAAS